MTEDVPRNHVAPTKAVLKVQPLKKDEMQPSYAQDLGLGDVNHGFYGSMMQALGSCVGFLGAIPCCPCPNPFKEVRQGTNSHVRLSISHQPCPLSQVLWDSSRVSANSTGPSIQAWSRSMSALSPFVTWTSRYKSFPLVGRPSSHATMSTLKCVSLHILHQLAEQRHSIQ